LKANSHYSPNRAIAFNISIHKRYLQRKGRTSSPFKKWGSASLFHVPSAKGSEKVIINHVHYGEGKIRIWKNNLLS